ncbi:MAG: acyltransferase [Janthinobacterium lividum]
MKFFLIKKIISFIEIYENFIRKNKSNYYRYRYDKNISMGENVFFGKYSSIIVFDITNNAKLVLKNNNDFRRFCLLSLASDGLLTIGEGNFFNNGCSVTCINEIIIGDNNLFGENIKIYDHNHIFSNIEESIREQGFTKGSVVIGNNCWIGSNCVILNNVAIGDNVIIGANNLIYKSIPSNSIIKAVSGFDIKSRF